ncbi:MAG: C69 family dipeptidase [Myxococcota bacterium]|nr:C69 family dipeptidase [Myxococcota bacterium]
MCDSIVASDGETAAGVPLYGKNSDRKPGECQPFVQHPEAFHPPGATVRCTHIEIPQVPETYRVMGHSPWWVWGFEHGLNEHGVAVGNHTVFSNELLESTPGLIGMDLVRLGLERGRTAREALEGIATLVERHGQGGAALAPDAGGYHNSFVLADPAEAWQLETSNRHWVARRVELEAVSNHFSIGTDWAIASHDLEVFCREEGYWGGAGRLDAAAAFRHPNVPPHVSEGRQRRARELLEAGSGRHDPASFAAILRDHGVGGPVWTASEATPREERFFTLCAHSDPVHWTAASIVAPLPADRRAPWAVWISFCTPCTGIFLPVYLHGAVPDVLARGGEKPEADSAWWTFKELQDAVSCDPPRRIAALRTGWAELERHIEVERARAEDEARGATRDGDPDAAAARVTTFMDESVAAALVQADTLRASL